MPAAIAVVITALILAAVAISLSHRPARQRSSAPTRPPTPSSQQSLLNILGALHRPQTALDRTVFAQTGLARPASLFAQLDAIDAASARIAAVTPWGARVLLVLGRRESDGQEGLFEWSGHGGGGGSSAADIEAGDDVSTQGWGASYAGGSTGVREIIVVPNGVVRVTFVLPQSAGNRTSGPSYAKPVRITANVHDNVAAFEAHRSTGPGFPPMIWYGANGQVIKKIGNVTSTETTKPTTHPASTPPTAESRAAQRDPATPNPVDVTPKSGGPSTTFRISWRLLLTGATYEFNPTGPQGSNCYGANAIPGGLAGGTTNVRGQNYGEALGPIKGSDWCPGTYHVTVTVLSFGSGRPSIHPTPRPFGAVTFSVR